MHSKSRVDITREAPELYHRAERFLPETASTIRYCHLHRRLSLREQMTEISKEFMDRNVPIAYFIRIVHNGKSDTDIWSIERAQGFVDAPEIEVVVGFGYTEKHEADSNVFNVSGVDDAQYVDNVSPSLY